MTVERSTLDENGPGADDQIPLAQWKPHVTLAIGSLLESNSSNPPTTPGISAKEANVVRRQDLEPGSQNVSARTQDIS